MYLEEFKQNMKSNANIRQGDGLIDIPDQDSEGSLQDELGSLQNELGGSFNSFTGHHHHNALEENEEVVNESDQTAAMVEVLKNCSKI